MEWTAEFQAGHVGFHTLPAEAYFALLAIALRCKHGMASTTSIAELVIFVLNNQMVVLWTDCTFSQFC